MSLFRSILGAAALSVAGIGAQAATLGVQAAAPQFAFDTGAISFLDGQNFAFSGFAANGAALDLNFAVDGGMAGSPAPSDLVFVSGAFDTVFGSVSELAADIGDGADRIEILFDVTEDGAGIFGPSVLAVLNGEFGGASDTFGAGPIASEATATLSNVTTMAPVPLPAGGLLLLAALGTLSLRRRS